MNIIKELYLFLINENIENKLNKKIKELENKNNFELAKEYKISYEIIINIFDEISNIFNNEEFTLDNFYKIFKIGLKNSSLGKIPASQDGVTVGDTERSRTHKVKAIFIIGLNDGVFPSVNKDEGFINDTDRSILKEQGIELAKGTIENLYDDNFNIYKAFTTAEEKLFLSYAGTDLDGKSLRPSTLILKIKKIFPELIEKNDILEKQNYFINEKELYEEFEGHEHMKVVCGTVGDDEHSVGMREIINIKHGGIEKWGIECVYLGTSVPVEKMVDACIEENAQAILASTIISHDNVHYKNMKRIHELCVEKGIRDKVIICAGGTQVIPEEAVKTGIDMGFGRNSHGIDVATFLAQERQRRRGEVPHGFRPEDLKQD